MRISSGPWPFGRSGKVRLETAKAARCSLSGLDRNNGKRPPLLDGPPPIRRLREPVHLRNHTRFSATPQSPRRVGGCPHPPAPRAPPSPRMRGEGWGEGLCSESYPAAARLNSCGRPNISLRTSHSSGYIGLSISWLAACCRYRSPLDPPVPALLPMTRDTVARCAKRHLRNASSRSI